MVTAPPADQTALALDAGTATSAVFGGYQRLSPSDAWDAGKGFGWAGTAPQARDRGGLDALRRDIVTDQAPRTLQVAVPPGTHDVHLLVGDRGFPSDAMTVSSDGRRLVSVDTPVPTGEFRWFSFTLDGGADGRVVDLELAAQQPSQFWRFASLVVERADTTSPDEGVNR